MTTTVSSLRAQYVYLERSLQMVTETCCSCGELFAMTRDRHDQLSDAGPSALFYCPNGHSQHYTTSRAAQERKRLERQLANAEESARAATAGQRIANSELATERRRHSATKGQLTKTRRRAVHGVCPCCSRSFANVARHVASQHPDAVADTATSPPPAK